MFLQLSIARKRHAVVGVVAALAVVGVAFSGAVKGPVGDVEDAMADEPAIAIADAHDQPAVDADGSAAAKTTGWAAGADGTRHWYDEGVMAADKVFYDPGTGA